MAETTVAAIFSKRNALELYLRVEIALARAEADLGLIPAAAATQIASKAKLDSLDLDYVRAQTERTAYPIAPLVRQLTLICGDDGQYIHWGATTQDILNTALALQVNDAIPAIEKSLHALLGHLATLTRLHRGTLMVARTFGGHALPTTFGFKAAVWLSGLLRHSHALGALRSRPLPGEFGGVAGTLASLDGSGVAVRARLMELLGLREPLITWASQRDRVVEIVGCLANLCGSLGKIAQDISDLAATEIGELAEPVSGGKDASSALPFKGNPVYCAQAMTSASLVAQHAATAVLAMRQHNERSGEGLVEAGTVPQAFVEAERCLTKLCTVVAGLQVFPERMRQNLSCTHGIILAERYMMALAPRIGRLAAHDLVHEACHMAIERKLDLAEVLSGMPAVIKHLDRDRLMHLADPGTYLGNALDMVDAVLAAVPPNLSACEQGCST
jgi:3-carboxy-cis,cis-muconate cycloisomerase